ncbi:MAG: hypothetical protein WDO15_03730 [Bacteroidota bacterium]
MDKATIKRGDKNTALILNVRGSEYIIPLTEDRPNDVKDVFNKLLNNLKTGLIKFELDDTQEDLYHHISKEYIKQLNSELKTVYSELSDYGLTKTN